VRQDPNCGTTPAPPARKEWPAGIRYPVFIIAVEGGGIYAASAASVFLARLADLEPEFDDHVFAISGVSGGSIGAAIFQALDRAARQNAVAATVSDAGSSGEQTPPCPQSAPAPAELAKQKMEIKARNIMGDDHLSPVIGSIFTEILGLWLSRPDALVASFERATGAQDNKASLNLCASFTGHWQPASFAPALALNTTWVEMGFPAAFAPFSLNDLDESLYSFVDQGMPKLDTLSLMQAAGASARFPVVMPPFSAVMREGNQRWNFVDGGYSDNSGSTTAMNIYKAVESVATQQVDLRLILITSSTPQPDLESDKISGTVFADTVAPLDALMKVRENLANNAVARACTAIYHDEPSRRQQGPGSTTRRWGESNEDCLQHAGGKDSTLNVVEIQDQVRAFTRLEDFENELRGRVLDVGETRSLSRSGSRIPKHARFGGRRKTEPSKRSQPPNQSPHSKKKQLRHANGR
jgi:hypothetical protein